MLLIKCFFLVLQCTILFHIWGMTEAAEDVPIEIIYMPNPTLLETIYDTIYSTFILKPMDVIFIAYKAENPTASLDAKTVKYDHMKKVAFYTHGFQTPLLDDSVSMKDAIFEGTNDYDCVILVDWRNGTFANDSYLSLVNNYKTAAIENVPTVGEYLAEFIDNHITNKFTYVHLLGHSLGAQISGIAARTVTKNNPSRVLNRISAMDPAGPIFEYGFNFYIGKIFPIITKHTLRKTDAKFVDVIHASSMLGMIKEAGHIDIYIDEVDCNFYGIICAHSKAFYVFKASINKCSQMVCPYGKLTNKNECTYESRKELSSLGILSPMYEGQGKYIARFFKSSGWFNLIKHSTGLCTDYLNVNLKAKERICYSNNKCIKKPYQTMCEEENKICKNITDIQGLEGPEVKVAWV
ncbi:phospholipase A1-like [Daktulosphaira vitifoliae]|uniref:phospholipase A1-like n=1 Tax=Daktulosphaira vitifoliae TaxID=58002 RepID=UPI0021AAA6DF|nr:phospholipase A1-like [Daktulosphaira vitifoliae]